MRPLPPPFVKTIRTTKCYSLQSENDVVRVAGLVQYRRWIHDEQVKIWNNRYMMKKNLFIQRKQWPLISFAYHWQDKQFEPKNKSPDLSLKKGLGAGSRAALADSTEEQLVLLLLPPARWLQARRRRTCALVEAGGSRVRVGKNGSVPSHLRWQTPKPILPCQNTSLMLR
jgi:hypothetical protein